MTIRPDTDLNLQNSDWGVEKKKQQATALPLIRWRGWRPTFLDFQANQRGGQTLLLLARGDERALLPCVEMGYVYYAPEGAEENIGWEDVKMIFAEAVFERDLLAMVHSLESEGWTVVGRLEVAFIGCFTEQNFWERVECRRCQPCI